MRERERDDVSSRLRSAKRSSDGENESSPKKQSKMRDCVDTPATKLARELEQATITSSHRKSKRLFKDRSNVVSKAVQSNRTVTPLVLRKNNDQYLLRKKTQSGTLDSQQLESKPQSGTTRNTEVKCEQVPEQNRIRTRSSSRCRTQPNAYADTNLEEEMEVEENNIRVTRSRSSSLSRSIGRKTVSSNIRYPATSDRLDFDNVGCTPTESSCQVSQVDCGTIKLKIRLRPAPADNSSTSSSKTKKATRSNKRLNTNDSDFVASDDFSDFESEDDESFESVSSSSESKRSSRGRIAYPKQLTTKGRDKPVLKSRLDQLRVALHTSEVPGCMPCREKEHELVKAFVESSVKKNAVSEAMYIGGVPGSGKTATVNAVVSELRKKHKFAYVSVNAMELPEPKHLFLEVYQQLVDAGAFGSDKRRRKKGCRELLNEMFRSECKSRFPILILIDELDQLVTKKQEIVYDIFNWTSCEEARVSVIAIANTLDLPQRLLSQKVSSRLGKNHIHFQPYSFDQIEKIIWNRVGNLEDLICRNGVQLAARKAAAVTGDLRRAMDLLRRATDIAIEKKNETVSLDDVNISVKEANNAPRIRMVVSLSRHSLAVFRSATSLVQRLGTEEFSFHDLYKEYCTICTNCDGIAPSSDFAVHHYLMGLCSQRLLMCSSTQNMIHKRVRLEMMLNDAQFAINQALNAVESREIRYCF